MRWGKSQSLDDANSVSTCPEPTRFIQTSAPQEPAEDTGDRNANIISYRMFLTSPASHKTHRRSKSSRHDHIVCYCHHRYGAAARNSRSGYTWAPKPAAKDKHVLLYYINLSIIFALPKAPLSALLVTYDLVNQIEMSLQPVRSDDHMVETASAYCPLPLAFSPAKKITAIAP